MLPVIIPVNGVQLDVWTIELLRKLVSKCRLAAAARPNDDDAVEWSSICRTLRV
jgi:hypothetical protein